MKKKQLFQQSGVDSFIAASNRGHFVQRYIIATNERWSENALAEMQRGHPTNNTDYSFSIGNLHRLIGRPILKPGKLFSKRSVLQESTRMRLFRMFSLVSKTIIEGNLLWPVAPAKPSPQ